MRMAIGVFGSVSLVATMLMAAPATFSSQTKVSQTKDSPTKDLQAKDLQPIRKAEPEADMAALSFAAMLPKGDRLLPLRTEEEVALAIAEELAANREPEGPPLPPPDISSEVLCHTLASVAQANGLPTGFFARLIWQESKFNQRVVSHAGAQGVAQFMPAVAAQRGLQNPFDPLSALPHSARFLKEHLQYFGNLGLAAAAYNAGARRVTDWLARRGRLPDETRNYVKTITGYEPEQWTETKDLAMPVALPRKNPCEGVADLSREAGPAMVAVQLEPSMQKIVEAARIAAAKAAAEAKARKLAALKSKRGKLLAKLRGGKNKAKDEDAVVSEKASDKPGRKASSASGSAKRTAAKADAKPAAKVAEHSGDKAGGKTAGKAGEKASAKAPAKIADRVTDKPKARVRVADSTPKR